MTTNIKKTTIKNRDNKNKYLPNPCTEYIQNGYMHVLKKCLKPVKVKFFNRIVRVFHP